MLLHDRSSEQIQKGLLFMDKLLAKDVGKGKITELDAKEARDRVSVVAPEKGVEGVKDVDMVVEVRFLCVIHQIPKYSRRLYPSRSLSSRTSSVN